MPYVSRGGLKLAHALASFGLDVAGRVALDLGASTGGFTDCLLQAGAARVHALDVGHGQLHWKLVSDPRVVVRDRINVRHLRPDDLPERGDLAVIDVSFISLRLVLPALIPLLAPGAPVVALVKPQFEVGPARVGKGGIVRDPQARARRAGPGVGGGAPRWVTRCAARPNRPSPAPRATSSSCFSCARPDLILRGHESSGHRGRRVHRVTAL